MVGIQGKKDPIYNLFSNFFSCKFQSINIEPKAPKHLAKFEGCWDQSFVFIVLNPATNSTLNT